MFKVTKIGNKLEIDAEIAKKNRIQANVARMNEARKAKREQREFDEQVVKDFYRLGRIGDRSEQRQDAVWFFNKRNKEIH